MGIVGSGAIGPVHAASVRRVGATVVSVASGTIEEARHAATEWGAQRFDESAASLITADDIDVVHICTPNDLHVPLARKALEAGKHVICEKPLAPTVPDARELADLARETGLVTAIPFSYRYHPMAWEAHARVSRGSIGRVRVIHGSYLQDWLMSEQVTNWRVSSSSGGASRAFADIGSHWCDLLEWVTGHRIAQVCSAMGTLVERTGADGGPLGLVDTEDAASLVFRTSDGAIGSLMVSQISPGRKNRLWFEVDGEHSSVVFDQEQPESLWLGDLEGARVLVRGRAGLSAEAERLVRVPAGASPRFP